MKLVKILAVFIVLFLATAFALNTYLGVDDLSKCGDKPSTQKKCQAVDAIVAISGGDTGARTNEAVKLFKNGWAKVLILSGAAADKSGPSNASVMRQQAIDSGVDPNLILIDESSENTAQNAEEASSIFNEYKIKSAILVTSGYHERRALLEFGSKARGVSVIGHPAPNDSQWGPFWWLTPKGWYLAVSEAANSVYLSVSGVSGE